MIKAFIILTVSLVSISNTITVNAQRKPGIAQTLTRPVVPSPFVHGNTADCDTLHYPVDTTAWSYNVYSGDGGYISGTNDFGDLQIGAYFNVKGDDFVQFAFITGVRIAFAKANGDLSRTIRIRVFDFNAGLPGLELGNTLITLASIHDDVLNNRYTDITFPTPIFISDSREFVVSVDYSSLVWNQDTIAIVSNLNKESPPNQTFIESQQGFWNNMSTLYSDPLTGTFDISLYIFPFVSATASACMVLPVKLLSFDAERKNNDVILNWKISDEYNMTGYEIERADNNGMFKTITTIIAVNSFKEQTYSFTNKNAFTISPTVQYRLKQVHDDGSLTYSRVINVKSNAAITDVILINPFHNVLKLQLSLATPQAVSINLYDMQGKLVARENQKTYNGSANSIIMSSTSTLKNGIYILKIFTPNEQLVYKVVKL